MGISGNNQEMNQSSYTPEFLELERKKRYGFINKMEELDAVYRIKLFLPSIIPPSELGQQLGITGEMPDMGDEYSVDADRRLDSNVRLRPHLMAKKS